MTVYAHMVTRNEEYRYLDCVLAAARRFVDVIHVHDDLSTDDTRGLAMIGGTVVTMRDVDEPAFASDEGAFRQAAWTAFERSCGPAVGDWVLALDADELLVGGIGLPSAIREAAAIGAKAVNLPIPEVFRLDDDGTAFVRTDGAWRGQEAPRLFSYLRGGRFRQVTMACGSTPTYVDDGLVLAENYRVELAHLGYATVEDRQDKFRRYYGQPGHSMAHVASILTQPTLEPYHQVPAWRGRRR